jgi:RNA polymerase sigma-70 factor (ECF subfamily)
MVASDFDRLGTSIRAMVQASTHDAEVAADVTQEAFLRLLREAKAQRYPRQPRAWLYRTAINLTISQARHAAVARRTAPSLARDDAAPGPEGVALRRERTRTLDAALTRLSAHERTAVVMAAEGASGEEIAAHLGRTPGATRSLMFRARGRLRRELEGQDAA